MKENDKLKELEQMLKDGTITQEEFDKKTKELNAGEQSSNQPDQPEKVEAQSDQPEKPEAQPKEKKKMDKKTIFIIVGSIILGLVIIGAIAGAIVFSLKEKDNSNGILDKFLDQQQDSQQGIEQNEQEEKAQLGSYDVVVNFTEDDLAWVLGRSTADQDFYYVCINRNGETVLQFKQYDYKDAPEGLKEVSGFHNGIAIVTDGENVRKVIDKEGNVIVAEGDDNCTEIISENTRLGYVIVEKVDDTYMGTTTMYGIMDNQGQFKVPLSEDNEELKDLGSAGIAKGIYVTSGKMANIDTGVEVEVDNDFRNRDVYADGKIFSYYKGSIVSEPLIIYSADNLTEIAHSTFELNEGLGGKVGEYSEGKIFIEYPNDNSEERTRGFFNEKLEMQIDLSELEITNEPVFIDGYADLLIRDGWYTVIDESGNMLFEPVKGTKCINLGQKRFYVETEDGECKIIDENNNVIAQPKYEMKGPEEASDETHYYTNGYYIADDLEEFVDRNGNKLIVYLK